MNLTARVDSYTKWSAKWYEAKARLEAERAKKGTK